MKLRFGCENIEKKFINRLIFKSVNISLENGSALAITGCNGSGKSTLVKILANLLKETSGSLFFSVNDNLLAREKYYVHIGFVAPYLNLYDELTAFENINFFLKIKSFNTFSKDRVDFLLDKVNLIKRKNDFVKSFSSGMKQRLKYAFAISSEPEILILDEPRSNLDEWGVNLAYSIAEEQISRGILIIATNDKDDLSICNSRINIEDYGKKDKLII